MLVPRIAEQTAHIRGVIFMAAPARPLEDLILNQTIYLANIDGNITSEEQNQINATIEQVDKIQNLSISGGEIILGAGLAYWKDLSTYKPIQTAQNLDLPMLFLQGKRDYQVTYEDDYKKWNISFNDDNNVSLINYETLNHLFITGEGESTNIEYMIPGNIAEQVIVDIVNWINSLLRST
jgi:hypothetical protein